MIVTSTEFKNNLGMYLEKAGYEDILITRNGRKIARLTSPEIDKVALWKTIIGSVPGGDEINIMKARDERLGL